MLREEVYRDMEGTLGMVPSMFKTLPDEALEFEWRLFKQVQVNEEVIPAKYRELIALAAGATLGDKYCVVAHRELAKVCGATDGEIEGAIRLAKGVAGWGTYLTGSDFDLETLRGEIGQICNFIRSGQLARTGQVAEAGRAGVSTH